MVWKSLPLAAFTWSLTFPHFQAISQLCPSLYSSCMFSEPQGIPRSSEEPKFWSTTILPRTSPSVGLSLAPR